MNNRIRDVRKTLSMTQDQFASALNLSKNFVWMIEKGEREPSDRTIKDICREYKVNETWLLTGNGEMFDPLTEEQEIAQILASVVKDDDFFLRELIKMVHNLSPNTIHELTDSLIELGENLKKKSHPED